MQTYLGCKNPNDTWISKCYSYAYWISNANYQNAHSKVGLSAQMGGTGMVFRPNVIFDIGWETNSLTEDLVLTTKYVLETNRPCHWIHEARLYDEKPLKLKPSVKQRTRWMQGHIDAMFTYAPKLFLRACKNFSLKQWDVAFYLCRPLLNITMFIVYLARILCNTFFPANFAAMSFFMTARTSTVLLLAYLLIQVFILYREKFL